MVNIEVRGRYPIDIQNSDFGGFARGTITAEDSSRIILDYGHGQTTDFRGHDFRFDSNGKLVSGTITGWADYDGNFRYFSVDGFSLSAQALKSVVMTVNTHDDFKLIEKHLSGHDTFSGGMSNDRWSTYGGADILSGGDGNDTLDGGDGKDRLYGGFGGDHLTGGHGNDTFVFKSANESEPNFGMDTIVDFSRGDKIDLRAIDANSFTLKNEAFKWIGQDQFSNQSTGGGELRFEWRGDKTYVFGDTNGFKGNDFVIRLDHHIDLTSHDFIL